VTRCTWEADDLLYYVDACQLQLKSLKLPSCELQSANAESDQFSVSSSTIASLFNEADTRTLHHFLITVYSYAGWSNGWPTLMGSGPSGNLPLHINILYCMPLICLQVVNKRSLSLSLSLSLSRKILSFLVFQLTDYKRCSLSYLTDQNWVGVELSQFLSRPSQFTFRNRGLT